MNSCLVIVECYLIRSSLHWHVQQAQGQYGKCWPARLRNPESADGLIAGEEVDLLAAMLFSGIWFRNFSVHAPLINRLQRETPVGSDSESRQLLFR
jgi:hypothetical protein